MTSCNWKIQDGCHITLTRLRLYCLLIGWFSFHLNSSMPRTKMMPRKAERERVRQVRTRVAAPKPSLEAPYTSRPPSSSTGNPSRPRWNEGQSGRGGAAQGGWEVTAVVANPTVGPDGCGGWAIYVRWEGANLKEVQSLLWKAKPPERTSWQLESWRRHKSTNWGPWLFAKYSSFKRT